MNDDQIVIRMSVIGRNRNTIILLSLLLHPLHNFTTSKSLNNIFYGNPQEFTYRSQRCYYYLIATRTYVYTRTSHCGQNNYKCININVNKCVTSNYEIF